MAMTSLLLLSSTRLFSWWPDFLSLRSQFDSLKEEKEGLEELLTSNQEKIDQLRSKVADLESNLESCSTVKISLEEEKGQLVQQLSWLEGQSKVDSDAAVKSLTDQLSHLESMNADLNLQVETFSASAKGLEDERNRLLQQLSEFETSAKDASAVEGLKMKLEELESINRSLRQQLDELKSTHPDPVQAKVSSSKFFIRSFYEGW